MEVEVPLSPVVSQTPDDCKGPFNAMAGSFMPAPLAGLAGMALQHSKAPSHEVSVAAPSSSFRTWPTGPTSQSSLIGADDLSRCDSVCRLTRELNRSDGGPWWALGRR
eukprot:CAMPEP_0206520876 /NCGR_PEP_ID=MMETSP0324_2-20121206/66017_1 /ASSEMBLY_ACC=CAM_ASM_000836 /TAXON_ID=2866 /ORGANISM="Crypthecodinium cohnii, Strain Seligo" /LENGTH=107 /DNA_ID=CAMNT_0054014671 /DNA_START=85 /DNA_END=405 /DNA_ORIENTATION=-